MRQMLQVHKRLKLPAVYNDNDDDYNDDDDNDDGDEEEDEECDKRAEQDTVQPQS